MYRILYAYVSAPEKSIKINKKINQSDLISVCPCLDEIRWYLDMLLVLIACQRFQKIRLGKQQRTINQAIIP
jgi:hypothetical protein